MAMSRGKPPIHPMAGIPRTHLWPWSPKQLVATGLTFVTAGVAIACKNGDLATMSLVFSMVSIWAGSDHHAHFKRTRYEVNKRIDRWEDYYG